jgi:methionyl-tRNA formyltransferase
MRLMDWSKSVAEIDRAGRAFGRFGALAAFDGTLWAVYGYDFWEEEHSLSPGAIAARMSREIVIAAADGFICLKDYTHLSR